MQISRRDFLKFSGAGTSGLLLGLGLKEKALALEGIPPYKLHKKVKEFSSICAYCAVGCGTIVAADEEGEVVNYEGDPDHPINIGRLDPKSLSQRQLVNSERRLVKPLYRSPGSDRWEEKSWDWMFGEIAKRIKRTRDATWVSKVGDVQVNRTEGIAWLGGASNNNEDCYLATKFMRSLGVVYIEHQARI